MPYTEKQRRAAGADVGRCEKGQKPKMFGSCEVAREFARKVVDAKRGTKKK